MNCYNCGLRMIVGITCHLAEDESGDVQCENCDAYNAVPVEDLPRKTETGIGFPPFGWLSLDDPDFPPEFDGSDLPF